MVSELLRAVRQKRPLVHSITNYVTANDCANLLLACGASPIMTDDPEEVAEVTAISQALTLNLGTLNHSRISSFFLSGQTANERNIPVVLDPVGAGGASKRTQAAFDLLSTVRFTAIRGNVSEIRVLANGGHTHSGVDAEDSDAVTKDSLTEIASLAKRLAAKTGAIVAVTGAVDVVADSERAVCVKNGSPYLRYVTGAGCMLSCLTAAFLGANPDNPFGAVTAAVCMMGVCGELAEARMEERDGTASFRTYLIDAIFRLEPEELERRANYECFS